MPKWLAILLHLLVIGGGVAGSVLTGTPALGALAGALNAIIPSPINPTPPAPVVK